MTYAPEGVRYTDSIPPCDGPIGPILSAIISYTKILLSLPTITRRSPAADVSPSPKSSIALNCVNVRIGADAEPSNLINALPEKYDNSLFGIHRGRIRAPKAGQSEITPAVLQREVIYPDQIE